jgi:MoaA/NifB/PqqE/SkfB family radical SAM enzyme
VILMLSPRFKPWHVPLFLGKYAWLKARRMPLLVHFEVTMRCNARCGFCDYWKTDAAEKDRELKSFADAAKFFNPMMVTFTGGEPTLRRDLEDLVSTVDRAVSLKYVTMITHGAMLSPERAQSLWDAGISQFNISLDYLDGRHDTARGIPGLTAKIMKTVGAMRDRGITAVRFNSVIKDDNLDQIIPIVERAQELKVGVNFSVYTDAKNGNRTHLIRGEQLRQLEDLTKELLAFKRKKRGIITNSDYYLENLPRYASGAMTEPCRAGMDTIHINPFGQVRRCPDFQSDFHWKDFRRYETVSCNACYYACRGEAQAPLQLSRVRDVMATPYAPA